MRSKSRMLAVAHFHPAVMAVVTTMRSRVSMSSPVAGAAGASWRSAWGGAMVVRPEQTGRPGSTPPKLIDEYYWVTITRAFTPPTRQDLAQWLTWAEL
jgi:hypothetical protein